MVDDDFAMKKNPPKTLGSQGPNMGSESSITGTKPPTKKKV